MSDLKTCTFPCCEDDSSTKIRQCCKCGESGWHHPLCAKEFAECTVAGNVNHSMCWRCANLTVKQMRTSFDAKCERDGGEGVNSEVESESGTIEDDSEDEPLSALGLQHKEGKANEESDALEFSESDAEEDGVKKSPTSTLPTPQGPTLTPNPDPN